MTSCALSVSLARPLQPPAVMAEKEQKTQDKGEGSYSGTRDYDEGLEKFREQGKVEDAARKAREDLEGPEAEELAEAEAEGKERSQGEDPELHRHAD